MGYNYKKITYKLAITKIDRGGKIKEIEAIVVDSGGIGDIEEIYTSMKSLDRIADIINGAKGKSAFILDVQVFAESIKGEKNNLVITGRGINTALGIQLCPVGNKEYPLTLDFSECDNASGKKIAEALGRIRINYCLW